MAFEKLSNFFGMNDDYDSNESIENEEYSDDKVVPMMKSSKDSNKASKIVIVEPSSYSDTKSIATMLLSNKAVIVNFTKVDENQSKRIVDFLTGTLFAINGEIKNIGDNIFLFTPQKFEVNSSDSLN